jgi:hypothetical protein
MQTSVFLARLLGPMLIVFGLAFAIHRKIYTAMAKEFIGSRSLVYLAGACALTGGLALVLTHNVWVGDWRVLITLIGWMATIAGTLRLLLPDMVRRVGGDMFVSERPVFITGVIWAVVGAVLCYAGYLR